MSSTKNRRPVLYVALSLMLTIAVLGYIFSHVTWAQVTGLIFGINLGLLASYLVLSLLMQVARTIRYRMILLPAGQYPGFIRLFLVVMVRGLCVDLLPARLGELVYVYILRARLGVDLGAASASFALAFLFDIMALTPLLVMALVMVGTNIAISPLVLIGIGIALLAVSSLLVHFLPAALAAGFGIVSRWKRGPVRITAWIARLMAGMHRQVRRAKQQGVYVRVFFMSLVVRLLKYGSLYVLLFAMLEPVGYTLSQLPFPKVFLGFCAAETSASLPISGIAGFGAYQGAWSFVFMLLGFPAEMAKVTSVSHHLLTQLNGYLLGIAALLALLMIPASKKPLRAGPK